MIDEASLYWEKAQESLAGAESELVNGRYNNCANRTYYSCFQAAITVILRAGGRPSGERGRWPHELVHGQFVGELINRRKRYPSELRDVLARNLELRQAADYKAERVSRTQAERALRRTHQLLDAVQAGGETT